MRKICKKSEERNNKKSNKKNEQKLYDPCFNVLMA